MWRQFGGGLWIAGGIDDLPDGTNRRGSGLHPIKTTSAWTRNGSNIFVPGGGHVLSSSFFADDLGGAAGGRFYYNLYKGPTLNSLVFANGAPVYIGAYNNVSSGIQRAVPSTARLTYAELAPNVGIDLWMYAAGGAIPVDSQPALAFNTWWGRIFPPSWIQGSSGSGVGGSLGVERPQSAVYQTGTRPAHPGGKLARWKSTITGGMVFPQYDIMPGSTPFGAYWVKMGSLFRRLLWTPRSYASSGSQTPPYGSFKVDPATGLSWNIGLEPPNDGMVATAGNQCLAYLDTYFALTGPSYTDGYWNVIGGLTAQDDLDNYVVGDASLELTIAANHTAAHIFHDGSLNLLQTSAAASWNASTPYNDGAGTITDPNGNAEIGTNIPKVIFGPAGTSSGAAYNFFASLGATTAILTSRIDTAEAIQTLAFTGNSIVKTPGFSGNTFGLWSYVCYNPANNPSCSPQLLAPPMVIYQQSLKIPTNKTNFNIAVPPMGQPGDRLVVWANIPAEFAGGNGVEPLSFLPAGWRLVNNAITGTLVCGLFDYVLGPNDTPGKTFQFGWTPDPNSVLLGVQVLLVRGSSAESSTGSLNVPQTMDNIGTTGNTTGDPFTMVQPALKTLGSNNPFSVLRLDFITWSCDNTWASPPSLTSGGTEPAFPVGCYDEVMDGQILWQNACQTATLSSADPVTIWIGASQPDNIAFFKMVFEDASNVVVNADIALNASTISQVAGTTTLTKTPLAPITGASGIGSLVSTPGTQVANKPLYTSPTTGKSYRLKPMRYAQSELDLVTTGAWTVNGQSISTKDPSTNSTILNTLNRSPNVVPTPAEASVAWQLISISLDEFATATGVTPNNFDWSSIVRWGFRIGTNAVGGTTLWLNGAGISAGPGMQGNYGYVQCFGNSRANIISNSNPTTVTVNNINRTPVSLTNIQQPTDPQVDTIIIYRTVGGGAELFFQGAYPVGTTYVLDQDADYEGFGLAGAPVLGITDIWPQTLQYDNSPPDLSWTLLAGPFNGSMFYAGDPVNPERVYYSPPGRPESIANWFQLSSPVQNMIVWNDALFVFTGDGIEQVQPLAAASSYSPGIPLYAPVLVIGAPGTDLPFSIIGGRNYIFYQAPEGALLFDGSYSADVNAALGPIFRDRAAENFTPFYTVSGCYARGEWILSDGGTNSMIALNEATQAWRNLGITGDGLSTNSTPEAPVEGDIIFGTILASNQIDATPTPVNQIASIEANGATTDCGTPIPWELQPGAKLLSLPQTTFIKRYIFDVNPNGQVLVPTIVTDAYTVVLPALTGAGRARFEYDFFASGQVATARLGGNISAPVELFSIEMEVEGGPGDAT